MPSAPIPTRMAQGIMTGIGFLGAGVIFKEGLTVRGLTTAASIWMTASIGILVGIGFWFPAMLGTVATLMILSVFRFIENKPAVRVLCPPSPALQTRCGDERGRTAQAGRQPRLLHRQPALAPDRRRPAFEYRMVIRSRDRDSAQALSQHLLKLPQVIEFRISPTGD